MHIYILHSNLEYLDLSNNGLEKINFHANKMLKFIDLNHNKLTYLDLTEFDEFTYVNFCRNDLYYEDVKYKTQFNLTLFSHTQYIHFNSYDRILVNTSNKKILGDYKATVKYEHRPFCCIIPIYTFIIILLVFITIDLINKFENN